MASPKGPRGPLPPRIHYALGPMVTRFPKARGVAVPVDVWPAFAFDPTSPTSHKTALNWAERVACGQDQGPGWTPAIIETDNAPLVEARLLELERRGEGGRAWQVQVPVHPDYPPVLVDVREDTLQDVLRAEGVIRGVFQTPMVWLREASTLRLTAVGSAAHRKAVEEQTRLTTTQGKVLGARSLVPGTLYQLRDRSFRLYGGRGDTVTWDVPDRGDTIGPTARELHGVHVWLYPEDSEGQPGAKVLEELRRHPTGRAQVTTGLLPCVEALGAVPCPAGGEWLDWLRRRARLAHTYLRSGSYIRDTAQAVRLFLLGDLRALYLAQPGKSAPKEPDYAAFWRDAQATYGLTEPGE